MTTQANNPAIRTSVWLLYVAIVFEILFMISPFAAYYYSAYAIPLNQLATSEYLGWLTQHIMPHFAYHTSTPTRVLLGISFPLVFVGLALFAAAFMQIYWAKFSGKGAVAVGLYKYIRHPQYVALGIVGLGTTLFWSRFLILISFITMLYLYVVLAKDEEKRCLASFGDSYQDYLDRTGGFFPRAWTRALPKFELSAFQGFVLYLLVTVSAVVIGMGMKHHLVEHLLTHQGKDYLLVSLADTDQIPEITHLLDSNSVVMERIAGRTVIAYLVPAAWSVPELGVLADDKYSLTSQDELLNPSHHGNNPDLVDHNWRVLIAESDYAGQGSTDPVKILNGTTYIQPLFIVEISNLAVEAIDDSPGQSSWAGIPVPIY